VLLPGNVGSSAYCHEAVEQTVSLLGGLDILVNNAAEQHEVESLEGLSNEQLERTFRTNIFSHFYLSRSAIKHMKPGSTIICTASVVAYHGHKTLLDYASTKGAIVAFVRSLSLSLAGRGIRVNAVAPGPIWTPLIPSTFTAEQVGEFGTHTPMGRAGQPDEVAPCYVFLAGDDASYMSGQTLHPNGGTIVGG
jgi:NAD(P)-dependent dehydrogenase (short-subunit alcohol dehydrogenase family)